MAALGTPLRNAPRLIVVGSAAFFIILLFIVLTPHGPRVDLSQLRPSSHGSGNTPATDSSSSPSSSPSSVASNGNNKQAERLYGKDYHGHSSPADVNRVTNDTLGFSNVFVVGLAERSDKRDAIALASSLTGFRVEWVEGVRGDSIPDKAVPFGVDRKKLWETNLGSWRGHMNAIRRIVEEDLDSALIMEDDMDWDVRLKAQLELVAQGTRSLQSSSRHPGSPYGDDWDVLWLGHCGELFPEDLKENKDRAPDDPGMQRLTRKFVIEQDATVPPLDHLTGLVNFTAHPEFTRWVHVTAAPICSFAYALSRRGAQKVLLALSVDGLEGPFDNSLAGLCRRAVAPPAPDGAGHDRFDLGLDARCLSVTPPLFFHHRAKGALSGDSDIQGGGSGGSSGGDTRVREKGTTENIVWSARNNLRNMLMGAKMENQFKGSPSYKATEAKTG